MLNLFKVTLSFSFKYSDQSPNVPLLFYLLGVVISLDMILFNSDFLNAYGRAEMLFHSAVASFLAISSYIITIMRNTIIEMPFDLSRDEN